MTIRTAFLVACDWCGHDVAYPVDTPKRAWRWAFDDGWTVRHGEHVCPSCATWRDTTTVQGATCVDALGPDASAHPPAGTSNREQAREWRETGAAEKNQDGHERPQANHTRTTGNSRGCAQDASGTVEP